MAMQLLSLSWEEISPFTSNIMQNKKKNNIDDETLILNLYSRIYYSIETSDSRFNPWEFFKMANQLGNQSETQIFHD